MRTTIVDQYGRAGQRKRASKDLDRQHGGDPDPDQRSAGGFGRRGAGGQEHDVWGQRVGDGEEEKGKAVGEDGAEARGELGV